MAEMIDKITKKASKVVGVAKLRLKLASRRADLDECYESLGRALFIQITDGTDMDEEIAALVAKCDKIKQDIVALDEEIKSYNSANICKFCNKINEKNAIYCANCGEELNK